MLGNKSFISSFIGNNISNWPVKSELSEMSEISEQGLKLLKLRLFDFHPYAKNEKSEMSEQGFSPFKYVHSVCKMPLLLECFRITTKRCTLCANFSFKYSFSIWKNLNFTCGSLGSTEWRVTHLGMLPLKNLCLGYNKKPYRCPLFVNIRNSEHHISMYL